MLDTLIANLHLSESESIPPAIVLLPSTNQNYSMQAVVRALLSSTPLEVTVSFNNAVRTRLMKSAKASEVPEPEIIFINTDSTTNIWMPSEQLREVLRRARVLYGAGLGLQSLKILTAVVIGATRPGWVPDDDVEDFLAVIDADICQAIVSSKQEIDAGRAVRQVAADVRQALVEALEGCKAAMQEAFPFERAYMDAKGWQTAHSLGW